MGQAMELYLVYGKISLYYKGLVVFEPNKAMYLGMIDWKNKLTVEYNGIGTFFEITRQCHSCHVIEWRVLLYMETEISALTTADTVQFVQ